MCDYPNKPVNTSIFATLIAFVGKDMRNYQDLIYRVCRVYRQHYHCCIDKNNYANHCLHNNML